MPAAEHQPSLQQGSAFFLSSYVRSIILRDERFLHFQLRQDRPRTNHRFTPLQSLADKTLIPQVSPAQTTVARPSADAEAANSWHAKNFAVKKSRLPPSPVIHVKRRKPYPPPLDDPEKPCARESG